LENRTKLRVKHPEIPTPKFHHPLPPKNSGTALVSLSLSRRPYNGMSYAMAP